MANYNLVANGATDIQTTFRFQLVFPQGAVKNLPAGANDQNLSVYCTSAQLPKAMQAVLDWHLPMGPVAHIAGKRTIEPITLEFVVPEKKSNSQYSDVYQIISAWLGSTFDLTTGFNLGKSAYAIDNLQINVLTGINTVTHTFTLMKAIPTNVEFGTLSTEDTNLLKVSMTLTYDYFTIDGTTTDNV